MPIAEEITQLLQNIYNYFASFTDIGDFFVNLWNNIAGWFGSLFG